MRTALLLAQIGLLSACAADAPVQGPRAAIRRVTGSTFELIPSEGQHPYCLIFTLSSNGVIRQLTMSRDNVSFPCPAGKPVGATTYRTPLGEGTVKVEVLFSSQRIQAASVAQQLLDLRDRATVSSMDLRLPGKATLETLSFTPEADEVPTMGSVIEPADGGAP